MRDSQIIEEIVKKYYRVSDIDNTKYSIIFHISGTGNEKTFEMLLNDLKDLGTTAFTNDLPDNQIIVISNSNLARERTGLKTLMFFISIITLVYTGYVYSSAYYSTISLRTGIIYGTILYAVPVIGILMIREAGKYLSLSKSHIKYKFPIFVPSPGIGTLGTINSNKNQFREPKAMINAGTISLLSGFFVSILFIIIGSYTSPFIQYSAAVRSPISALNFPLVFPIILDHFIPVSIAPAPLALAGYTGLVTTALNALPIGFLDGGLIFSAIFGRRYKYVSYFSTIIIILASILEPYLLILVALLFLLGIRGALPMNNLAKPGHMLKYITVLVIFVILLGFAPLPFHNINSSSVAIADSCYIIDKDKPGNVTVNVTVNEQGVNIIPSFSVHPGRLKVEGHEINNSTATTYDLDLITYRANYSGIKDFNITVNTGTSIFHKRVEVYFLEPVENIHVNNSTSPMTLTEYQGMSFNLTLHNNCNMPVRATLLSVSNHMDVYMMPNNNAVLNLSGNQYLPRSFSMGINNNTSIMLEATTPGIWHLLLIESNGMSAVIITINVMPSKPSIPQPDPPN